MAKEIEGTLKLQVPAGQANPSPPVGPALGQRGINIMDFCKMFNDKSKNGQPDQLDLLLDKEVLTLWTFVKCLMTKVKMNNQALCCLL